MGIFLSLIMVASVKTMSLYPDQAAIIETFSWTMSAISIIVLMIATWSYLLSMEGRQLAQDESQRQTQLLINEIKAHERTDLELQQSKEKADAANIAKSRYLERISHELRTPLSALKVNVYNLSKQLHGSTDIDDLFNSLNRMSHLIDQLLLLYRASSENLRTEFEKVDLHALCQMIIQDRYETIAQREQEIELIGDATVILGNEFALSAMISNLIDNASKYSDRGGSILVKLSPQAGRYVLSVEDSGIGIPETLRKRVLDRFFRVNSGSPIQGCGLGLSIVQHVAVLHHANLAISDSSFETGTCVSLSFPYYASSLYS